MKKVILMIAGALGCAAVGGLGAAAVLKSENTVVVSQDSATNIEIPVGDSLMGANQGLNHFTAYAKDSYPDLT
ncbi:MAG: hypothetical protein IKM41_04885, partial [Tidjanibacter sp.]|nr:hypothetical protein [Tidjanibacter sp.]